MDHTGFSKLAHLAPQTIEYTVHTDLENYYKLLHLIGELSSTTITGRVNPLSKQSHLMQIRLKQLKDHVDVLEIPC
jgi:hypothetical protein